MKFRMGTSLDRRTVPQESPHWVLSPRRGDQLLTYLKGNSFSQRTMRRDVCQEVIAAAQDPMVGMGTDSKETCVEFRVCIKGLTLPKWC